jgi:DNA-binding NarL/FixJ family response regulator
MSMMRRKTKVETTDAPAVGFEQADRKLGVILVDPLPTVRAGLQMLISAESDLQVLAEAGSSDEVMADIVELGQKTGIIVVVGLGLPGEHDSFWLIRTIRERYPTMAILGCGANADKMAISKALFVGADGFVDKNAAPADFLDALRRSSLGEVVMVGPPSNWLGDISEEIDRHRDHETLLTDREREVLAVAAEGVTARQIGERLGLQERTVTTHLGRIYSKLGVSSRVAAVSTAARAGLIPSPIER